MAWGAIMVIGSLGLYLIAMNVFLRTRLFRDTFRDAQAVLDVEYSSAYSVVPGRIHVDGLVLRGGDSAVEWVLRLDRCDFSVVFTDLLRRRFHATHVIGDGVEFRIRLRFDEAAPDHVAALPPIDGFIDPPLKTVGPPTPDPTDAEYALWSTLLEDVDARHVRELWIDTIRYTGQMRIAGRWLFRPLRTLQIGPATVDVTSGAAAYGPHVLVDGLAGRAGLTLSPSRIRPDGPSDVLQHLSVTTDLRGVVRAADAMRTLAQPAAFDPVSGEGPVVVRAIVDAGALRPGTLVRCDLDDAQVSAGGATLSAAVHAEARVELDAAVPTGTLRIDLPGLRVRKDAAEALASSVTVVLSRALDLSRPFEDTTFRADLLAARTDAPGAWLARLAPGKGIGLSGQVHADVHLQGSVSERQAHGDVAFGVRRARATHGDVALGTDLVGTTHVDRVSLADERLVLGALQVELDHPLGRAGGIAVGAAAVTLQAARATLSFDGAPKLDVSRGELALDRVTMDIGAGRPRPSHVSAGRITLGAPFLRADGAGARGSVSLEVPSAQVTQVASLLSPATLPAGLRIEGGRARVSLRMSVELPSFASDGEGDIQVRDVTARAGDQTSMAAVDLHLGARVRGSESDVSESRLLVTGKTANQPAWWGSVELHDATLAMQPGLHLRAKVRLSAKDAAPVVPVLATTKAIPKWLANMPPTERIEGRGDLDASPSSLALRSFSAHGGQVAVHLAYSKTPSAAAGALLFAYGSLNVGVGLGQQPGIQLVGAERWFDDVVGRLQTSRPGTPAGAAERQGSTAAPSGER